MSQTIPDSLILGNSEEYILSIRLWSDGLSFSVYDPNDKKSFIYREDLFNNAPVSSNEEYLKDFFFKYELLSYTYKTTYVLLASSQYTIVPSSFVTIGEESSYLKFNFLQTAGHILNNQIPTVDSMVAFDIEENVYQFFLRNLTAPIFVHSIESLLPYWKKESEMQTKNAMFVYLHNKKLDITCFSNGKLLFINSYSFNQLQDVVYLLMAVWQQQEFDQIVDKLYIQGNPALKNNLAIELNYYIKHITQTEMPSEVFFWGADALKAPLDLLTLLTTCE